MSRKYLILFVLLIFIGGLLSSQESTQKRGVKPVVEKKKEENKNQKIALVIGNSSYEESPLKNPVNDAIDTGDVLKKCGFEVTLKTNANKLDMEKAVREFSDRLKDGGIGFFYFSGHGVQVDEINYLIPVKSDILDEVDVKAKAVKANYILGKMDRRKDGMNIMILDACRNNPYARSFRSPSPGLAQMDHPKGSLIVYATSPGKTANDGTGRNGIFTKHLLKMIKETPFEIMVLLRKVRKNVMDETSDKQIPWESSSLLGSFYFSYTDTQLEKIKVEISELQSQIKDHEVQRREFEKIKSEKEEREAARKEEEKKAQLKLKKLEEERLLKEKERQERLKQEEERLAREEAQERTERERQKAAAEKRLNQLREKFAKEEVKLKDIKQEVLSVYAARKEIVELKAKIERVQSIISIKMNDALKQLKENYDLTEKKMEKPIPPKGQFETTADYNERVEKEKKKIHSLRFRYVSDYWDIRRKYENDIAERINIYENQIDELKRMKYPVGELKVELLNYNADKELYKVRLLYNRGMSWYYSISVNSEIAKGLFERKELLKAKGYYANIDKPNSLNSLSDVFLIDPISGKYQFNLVNRLRSHYITLNTDEVKFMLKLKGFFDSRFNQTGDFSNQFELMDIEGDKVVLDYTTGLMWHQSGPPPIKTIFKYFTVKRAERWIKRLNNKSYAGFQDWRLPTIEEAASLLSNAKKNNYPLYINPIFSSRQWLILTGDKIKPDGVWMVNFQKGRVGWNNFHQPGSGADVLPVRCMQ